MIRNIINVEVMDMLDGEELEAAQVRRPFYTRKDPFELSDRQFMSRYRLSKAMVDDVINIVEERSVEPSRKSALDPTVKVLTALRFFASGSYQVCVGHNIYSAMHQSSVSRSIRDVVTIFNEDDVFSRWVNFPENMQALREVRNGFYTKYNFPGVIGCVDCTHIAIIAPQENNVLYPEHIYVNRKQYHSINVQLICDSNMKIINVNARFPGSTHDSFIWNRSAVLPLLRTLNARGYENLYLLGDSGYALRPWILTPLPNPLPGTPEAAYNERLTSTRSIIERCNGLLKMRFRCLLKHRTLHYAPEVASKIINTCTILHNMCIENNIPQPDMDDINDVDIGLYPHENNGVAGVEDVVGHIHPDLARARILQRRIIRTYFS